MSASIAGLTLLLWGAATISGAPTSARAQAVTESLGEVTPAPTPSSLEPEVDEAGALDPCGVPEERRPPDPRCGERLDGRPPPSATVARQVGRAALTPPRLVAKVALWPVVKTADFVEHHHLVDRGRAILTSDDGLIGVRPELQYSTSFLPTGGLRVFYRRLPGPGSEIMTRFRTGGPSALLGQLGLRGPDWLGLSILATWSRRSDRLFAGTGPNTDEDLAALGRDRARFGSNNLGAELRWWRRLPWGLVAQAQGGFDRRDYQASSVRGGPSVVDVFGLPPGADACVARGLPSSCVDEAELPGFYTGLRIARLGAGLGFDRRSGARDGRGVSALVNGSLAQGVAGDPSRHAHFTGQVVGAVGGDDRVVLLRLRAAMVERLGAAPIPFDELIIPSGLTEMRGFPDGRLRGHSALVGSTEYRWYISSYLDATLFVDVGTVAGPKFSQVDWTRLFPSFGLGFRLYAPQGTYWEAPAVDGIQIAYAPEEGFRALISMAAF